MGIKVFFVITFLLSTTTYALNMSSCSTMMNKGWYKKYSYMGIDQPLTKGTKRVGSSKASSEASTESSTASLDPKISTNQSSSYMQGTSSWGPCSSLGVNEVRETRDLYFAQNREEILKEIAMGQGEHLNVLASYSFCDKNVFGQFSTQLQEQISKFIDAKSNFGKIIDQSVKNDEILSLSCYSFEG